MSDMDRKLKKVPLQTLQEFEVQTEVSIIKNNIQNTDALQIFDRSYRNLWINEIGSSASFPDIYLLEQFEDLLGRMKENNETWGEDKTKKLVFQLSDHIHGLLTKELRLKGKDNQYYELLRDRERQIIRLQLKLGYYEEKINNHQLKVQNLNQQIMRLRETLKIYQKSTEENQLYKQFFREIQKSLNRRNVGENLETLIHKEVIPKMNTLDTNLSDLAKYPNRERNKSKGAICKFAGELDRLLKDTNLNSDMVGNCISNFYSSIEHMNSDNWIERRIRLAQDYDELHKRHISILSILRKNIDELQKDNSSFKSFNEILEFEKIINEEHRLHRIDTIILNGWVGLGVVSSHSNNSEISITEVERTKKICVMFQCQIKKLLEKYPQVVEEFSTEMRQFMDTKFNVDVMQSLAWVNKLVVQKSEVVTVQNVYKYHSKQEEQRTLHLRVIIKALIEEIQKIRKSNPDVKIELDQSLLAMLNKEIILGINIEDILALYRPPARYHETGVIVHQPEVQFCMQQTQIPLIYEKGVVLNNIRHIPVEVEKNIVAEGQRGVPLMKQKLAIQRQIKEVPFPVHLKNEKIVESLYENQVLKRVDCEKQIPLDHCNEKIQIVQEQKFGQVQVQISNEIPIVEKCKQIIVEEVEKQVPKYLYERVQQIVQVPEYIPVIYEKPEFNIIEKKIPYTLIQPDIRYIPKTQVVFEKREVAVEVEAVRQVPVHIKEHCECQKPDAVEVIVEKELIQEIGKEIIVEKCVFVKGDEKEKIIEVEKIIQKPVIQEVIHPVDRFEDKIIPITVYEQKLVVEKVDLPVEVERYVPVTLEIQKPVILRDECTKEVRVEVPVPIIIEKEVPKIIHCTQQKIVQKIVEVPRVEVVQKIVQKLVVVPRIVERIVQCPQIVEKIVPIEKNILEIVPIVNEKLVIEQKQSLKQERFKEEVLVKQKVIEVFEVDKPIQCIHHCEVVKEVERQVEKIVPQIIEKEVVCVEEKIVESVVCVKEVIPVEYQVQIPVHVEIPVPVEKQRPVFYKQIEEVVHEQRFYCQKVIQLDVEKVVVHEVKVEVPMIKEVEKCIPGETEIICENTLQIVEFTKNCYVKTGQRVDFPVQKYVDMDKVVRVDNTEYITPPKHIEYLAKPQEIQVQKVVQAKQYREVPVVMTHTNIIDTRTIVEQVKTIECQNQKLIEPPQILIEKPYPVQVTQQISVKPSPEIKIEKQNFLVVDCVEKQKQVQKEVIVEKIVELCKQVKQVPVYLEKVIQNVLMLDQVVEVEKKVYLVEEINTLIAKNTDTETHTNQYSVLVERVQEQTQLILTDMKKRRDRSFDKFVGVLQQFQTLVHDMNRMPKIVERVKQVIVEKEKDRPVLIPVRHEEKQLVFAHIIRQFILSLKNLKKQEIKRILTKDLFDLFEKQLFSFEESENNEQFLNRYGEQMHRFYEGTQGRSNRLQNLGSILQLLYLNDNLYKGDSASIIEKQRQEINKLILQLIRKDEKCRQVETYYRSHNSTQGLGYKRQFIEKLFGDLKVLENTAREGKQFSSIYDGILRSIERYNGEDQAFFQEIKKTQFTDTKITNLYETIERYESRVYSLEREKVEVERQRESYVQEIDLLRSQVMPTHHRQQQRTQQKRIQKQWESRMSTLKTNYEKQIEDLRTKLNKNRQETSNVNNDMLNENRTLNNQLRTIKRQLQQRGHAHENQKKRIIDSYEMKIRDSTNRNQSKRQLDSMKRIIENNEKKFDVEKTKLISEYQAKITRATHDQERQLRRQIQMLKKKIQTITREKQRQTEEIEKRYSSSSNDRELKRENQSLKKKLEQIQTSWQLKEKRLIDENQRRIRSITFDHQQEINKVRVTGSRTRGDQSEVRILKEKIQELQNQLVREKKQVEALQKSHIRTNFSSNIRGEESDFQSPPVRRGMQSQVMSRRVVQMQSGSRVSSRRGRREQSEEVVSSSSRASETTFKFSSSMTMREFMNLKKSEQKDNIATMVMIKVIEKIQEESDKGIINSYNPSNIFMSHFNPNNIESLIVRFGAPITNKNSTIDGLYLAPEIHTGQGLSLKSVVFTLAVIWDELIHYEIYFKTLEQVKNLSYEFKVRDTRLNPILKNTLFEMMSKEPTKRLDLIQAKRRLSLQRYILSEGRRND